MVQIKDIDGILKKIVSGTSGDSFKIDCIYSDGQAQTVYMISFFNAANRSTHGKISFDQHSGKVSRCIYRKHFFNDANDIIDTLLDVYNHQRLA